MKLFFTVLSLLLLATFAGAQPVKNVYRNVRGQIIGVSPAKAGTRANVLIDHENIPNFMAAMRMTLPLRAATDAKKLKRGDKIRFDLTVRPSMAITNVRKLPPQTKLKLAR